MIIMSNNNIIQRKSKSILDKENKGENKKMLGLGLLLILFLLNTVLLH